MKIITYATHSEGSFNELINNRFQLPIIVLGYGERWNGFMDKFKKMYNYIQILPDNEIIVFIDGFDSYINQPGNVIKDRFLKYNANIVLSEHPSLIGDYINRKVFGICENNTVANSGLYIGYNKDIKKLLKHILESNYSNDDQRNLNAACSHFDNIKLDKEKKIFHNQSYYERYFNTKTDSCFVSTPGVLTLNRTIRSVSEYSQFLWKEILLVLLLIIIYILMRKYRKN